MSRLAPWWPATVDHGDLVLRPLRASDQHEWTAVRHRNADWLRHWEATQPGGGRMPSFREMVRSLNRQAKAGTCLPWAITVADPRAPHPALAGQVTVSTIMWGSAMSASIGYWIDQARAGQGIVPQAVALAGDFCFSTLGLHRLEINIRPENGPSLRVVEKLGFRDEGVRERFLHINGQWADHRTFALTRDEVTDGLLTRLNGA
ncbi:GNAT family N-acetyltransferase [Zhihengliuella flava]|uniref:Ribosomal-protein-alanine N-acetyltransferase n=1 Tax=Zhihengliuella flava TaxID=1285193 RepID=A0A931DDC2_9MICC|nr:GNAT family protein [Zhihengliuella flava]MBG6085486.1 ribosomal-protein-alanine N-acetyltransferase [Zhihengliuella flava]